MRNLVLWGHDLADYSKMFDLTDNDLDSKIFEYGSGATSFNFEMTQQNKEVVSADELFHLSKTQIVNYFEKSFKQISFEIERNQKNYNWPKDQDLKKLLETRHRNMRRFFDDYALGQQQKRYVSCKASHIPFADFSFKIALSSHYLFANIPQQDENFHVLAISELARIANEVRIFPLIDRHGEISALLGGVMLKLQQQNLGVEVRAVPYSLQAKGNAMLRVWAQQCKVD